MLKSDFTDLETETWVENWRSSYDSLHQGQWFQADNMCRATHGSTLSRILKSTQSRFEKSSTMD